MIYEGKIDISKITQATISIDGPVTVNISGNANIKLGGNANVEAGGTATLKASATTINGGPVTIEKGTISVIHSAFAFLEKTLRVGRGFNRDCGSG